MEKSSRWAARWVGLRGECMRTTGGNVLAQETAQPKPDGVRDIMVWLRKITPLRRAKQGLWESERHIGERGEGDPSQDCIE